MKKMLYTFIVVFALSFVIDVAAQSIVVGVGQYSSTANTYGPMRSNATANQNNRHAYIYPSSLLTGLNHGDLITSIEFERTGVNAMVGVVNFKIYLGTTSMATWGTVALPWDTATSKAALFYNADPTAAVGASAGFKKFTLSSPFTYDTTNGKNLIVLCEYTQDIAQTAAIPWLYDNATGVPGYVIHQVKYSSGSTLPTSLATGNERHPKIKINFPKPNDAAVTQVYTYGKLPIPFGNPHVIQAQVTNSGTNALTNLNVTLNVSGANVFTDTKSIASLAVDETALVTFSAFSPSNSGANTVEVSVPNDDANGNNMLSKTLETNLTTFSFNQGTTANGGAGFTGATGDFVAKFTIASQQTLNGVDLVFNGSGQPYQVGVWDATGVGGLPGAVIFTSDTLTSALGLTSLILPNVTIPSGNFYIGVSQIGSTNVAFAFQTESPLRGETFYYASPVGSITWVDFASGGLTFRLMIDPKFALANDVAVTSIDQSGTTFYPEGTAAIDMTGEVANLGINSATFTVKRTIYSGTTSVYSNTQSVTNLAPSTAQPVTFLPFSGFVSGTEYTIKDSVNLAGDANNANDLMTTSFTPKIAKPLLVVYSSATANERGNRDSTLAALNAYGATYDTLNRGNGLFDLTAWSTVIWCEEGSILPAERTTLMDFLNAGTEPKEKSLIIAGDDIGYFHGRAASTTLDTTFYWHYLHAEYFLDDGNGTPDQSRICGVVVNPGLCDSISSSFPDGIGVLNGGQVAYRFAELPVASDTVVGVVYDGLTYNVAYFGFEFREIITSVTEGVNQIMNGALNWVIDAGGSIPVELVAFNVNVDENNVTLKWSTATETNNQGFAVERKSSDKQFEQIVFIKGKGTTTERASYSFMDAKLNVGNYTYRLKQIDFDGTSNYSNEVNVEISAPKVYALEQNYPNPFNPATKIKYAIPVDGFVNLTIYNTLGERVKTLVSQIVKAGNYEIDFNASNLASGIYFYRLEAGKFVSVKKMMLLK